MVNGEAIITPKETNYTFKTDTRVPRVGMMIVGFGGNNGSTVLAGVIANREYVLFHIIRALYNAKTDSE